MKKLLQLTVVVLALLQVGLSNITVSAQETVVVYTNSLDDPKREWLEDKIDEADFSYNVEFVIGGGGEIFDRLMAEANDPQADVGIGMDEGQWTLLSENGLVREWNPEWKTAIPSDLISGDGYFYPWAEQRILAYYNPDFLEAEQVPNTLEGIAFDENLVGKFIVPQNLGGSTNQKIVFSILLQSLDENGEYGVSEEGWATAEAFLNNGYMPSENEDKHILFADGETPISFHFSGGIPNAEREFGFTVIPINPEYGVFSMSEQVGIINKGDDYDYKNAIEFAEWWGSEEIQREWVEAWGTVPANENIIDSVDERILEIFEQTTRMDVDWDIYNQYSSDWVEKIELELMPL